MTQVTTVYDRFTELAKRALVAARDAAASLGHDTIGTEDLLLGLAQTAGVASETLRAQGLELNALRAEAARHHQSASTTPNPKDALSSLGIDIHEIQRRAEETFGPGALKYPRPPFSLNAKQAIKESLQQARALENQHIDTEHLLLALLATGGTAVSVLTAVGADPESLRHAVLERCA
jgi:ATP-dependent Clp protease ATP-binding subunit ClpA